MNTRFNIKKLNENSIQKHEGLKQVGLKKLGTGVKTRVHAINVESVWFMVELQEVMKIVKLRACIMKTEVLGQEGAEGNVVGQKKRRYK
ncbi:hypothetical protein Tco_1459906 [Tanacetum coccineum]